MIEYIVDFVSSLSVWEMVFYGIAAVIVAVVLGIIGFVGGLFLMICGCAVWVLIYTSTPGYKRKEEGMVRMRQRFIDQFNRGEQLSRWSYNRLCERFGHGFIDIPGDRFIEDDEPDYENRPILQWGLSDTLWALFFIFGLTFLHSWASQ